MYIKFSNQPSQKKNIIPVNWIALFAGILIINLLVLTISTNNAYSMSNGLLTGRSTTGCAPCHNPAANLNVKVIISGPTTVTPGNTARYTIAINGGPEAGGGLNASASEGKLSPGDNTQLFNNEITHKDKNSRSWVFSWTAPAVPGQYTISTSGNAVNKDGSPAGDGWNVGRLEYQWWKPGQDQVPHRLRFLHQEAAQQQLHRLNVEIHSLYSLHLCQLRRLRLSRQLSVKKYRR